MKNIGTGLQVHGIYFIQNALPHSSVAAPIEWIHRLDLEPARIAVDDTRTTDHQPVKAER